MKRDLALHFGRVIRRLREQKSLSQEEFAGSCNLHRTYIGSIERGEKNVTLETAFKLAAALNIQPSYLISLLENELDELTNDKFS